MSCLKGPEERVRLRPAGLLSSATVDAPGGHHEDRDAGHRWSHKVGISLESASGTVNQAQTP